MKTIILALVCGFIGYQVGKSMVTDNSEFLIEKKTKLSESTEEVSYLKITSTGQILFVPEKEQATMFSKSSAKNAVEFLLSLYKDSSINLLSV
jgi:hypothetical protein